MRIPEDTSCWMRIPEDTSCWMIPPLPLLYTPTLNPYSAPTPTPYP